MSTPEATTTRQRNNYAAKVEDEPEHKTENPASLSGNPNKKVERNKPKVKPPFIDVPMNKFLSYLVLSLLAVLAFYGWRFTVYARDAGGYWNLVTGRRPSPVADAAASAVSVAASAASAANTNQASNAPITSGRPAKRGSGQEDIQSQIYNLATALGIKPAELSNAIRPLIDPSVPNPAEAAARERELLEAKVKEAQAGSAKADEPDAPGFLGIVGEALLD